MQDDKEKLVDEILDLRHEVKTLREKNEALEIKLEQVKNKSSQKSTPPGFVKALRKKRSLPPHRWGRKKGHPGSYRPAPDHIHREVLQTLVTCPDCHTPLGKPVALEPHIQEDIVPPHVEATRFLHARYWCPCCKKVMTAPCAPDEVPCSYLGPRTLATLVWLKYHLALPGNKIKDILYDLCGLTVSEGAIAQALQRLGQYLQVETEQILYAVKEAAHKHVDETGWKINGIRHWLWTFVNREWALFRIDRSRGSRVPKEILGCPHQGTVSSDFYSAYNKLHGDKQKCLVHLRRDIHKARDAFPPGQDPPLDFLEPEKKLKRLLADAERLAQRRGTLSPLVFARRARRLKGRLFDFGSSTYSHAFWKRISARLLKHTKELFTFVDKPGMPSDNNAAERAIRPHVIIRNRSFQNRTDNGAMAHGRLSSILQTLRLQKRPVIESIMAAYPKHRQGYNAPVLFPTALH
jgi:transposase